jgi:hypothetical protein
MTEAGVSDYSDPDIHDTLFPPCYFRVIHKAGVRVREAPLQSFDPHSQVRLCLSE